MQEIKFDTIDTPLFLEYQERAKEKIFTSKDLELVRGRKTNKQINRSIIDLMIDHSKKRTVFIKSSEKLNINPYYFPKESIELFKLDNLIIQFPNIDIDSEILDMILNKWYAGNNLDILDLKNENIRFYYNDAFSLQLSVFKDAFKEKRIEDIKFEIDIPDSPIIYKYNLQEKSDMNRYELLKQEWIIYNNSYEILLKSLQEEEHYSSRGDFFISDVKFYSMNNIIIYEAVSLFFFFVLDEYLILHARKPEIFADGYEPIVENLYTQIKERYNLLQNRFPERRDFELFLKQQFYYLGSKEKHLRIDLFRNLFNKDNSFQGGIFHALGHFVKDEKSLSFTEGNKGTEYIESEFFNTIRQAFFFEESNSEDRLECTVDAERDNKEWLIGFYYDEAKKLYYLNTLFLRSKKSVKK